VRHAVCIGSAIAVLAMASLSAVAQVPSPSYEDEQNDNPRANVNISTPIVIPLNPTAQAVHLGFGFAVGGGYNFTRRHGLIGEYMWNSLIPTNEAQALLRAALDNPTVNASADVMALTGNYRFELRGKARGTYFIGGAGLYYRHSSLSQTVTSGSNISCTPMWVWWGFTCTSGTVDSNQTIRSWSSSSGGFNGGVGFTARVGDAPYRFYAESRYHYAPTSRVSTQLINISFGFRY
jgi:hypothetical protein